MRVETDDLLAGCPDECPYAAIEVHSEEARCTDGVCAVFVTVSCVHRPVCRHRAGGNGGARVGDD